MTPLASRLYDRIAGLPIIDYHNHLDMALIRENKPFANITRLWIASDPYKHRAMRILGVPERLITGEGSDYEKFEAFYGCLPRLVGNPLFVWARMEFEKVFGFDLYPFTRTAKDVWNAANGQLATLPPREILGKFNIAYCAPCTGLCDDLSPFADDPVFAPSLRGDDLTLPSPALMKRLEALTGQAVTTLKDYIAAASTRLDAFVEFGCRYTDHALDSGFTYLPDDGVNAARFAVLQRGEALPPEDRQRLASYLLKALAGLYARRGLTMQLHVGALRHTSTRLRAVAGPAGGYAAIGNTANVAALTALLDDIDQSGGLPRTLLFTLNPADNAVMATLSGSFSRDGQEAVVSQGPAWWWCDHAQGMRDMLEHLTGYGVLSTFVGMTTDSRSLLSMVRHEYFRRVLCQWIAAKVEQGDLPADEELLHDILQKSCYVNAYKTIQGGKDYAF